MSSASRVDGRLSWIQRACLAILWGLGIGLVLGAILTVGN